jgi:hypothetical protein
LYALYAPDGSPEGHVVVTGHGVYQATAAGEIHDFWQCLYARPAKDSQADALTHVGYSLADTP